MTFKPVPRDRKGENMGTNLSAGIMSAKAAPSDLAQRIMSRTSKGCANAAILMLADGTVFYGRACGAAGTACGEVCFNTSLEGYFEVLTDPSYAGQIVTMTYPQIGNYGIRMTCKVRIPAQPSAVPQLPLFAA